MTLSTDALARMQATLAAHEAPGAALALIVEGQLATVGLGFRDLARTEPMPADARCYLYSITKTLLAVAALRLVEQGRLALDEPVQPLLPELTIRTPISLRQLLNHSAGLLDYGGLPAYHSDLRADPGRPWTDADFLARTLGGGLLFPPGAGWTYSNIGYLLVRRLVARFAGESLPAALDQAIVAPLGLRQTSVAESLSDADQLTPGYSAALDSDGALRDIAPRYHPGWVSHGVVIATAADTALILDTLFAGRLLGPASLAAMLEPVDVPGDFPPFVRPGYGLGLMLDSGSPYGVVAGHAGGGPGYSTAAFHFPDAAGRRVTAAALVNRDGGNLAIELVFKAVRSLTDETG